jgi:hypothetical protein
MPTTKAEVEASFALWVKENTPPGTRLTIRRDGLTEIELCCNGIVTWTALYCGLSPGHEGDCWSQGKNVNFTPEKGGPIDYLVTLPPREGL